MACYEHINLTLMFHKYLLHMFVKTIVYTYVVRNQIWMLFSIYTKCTQLCFYMCLFMWIMYDGPVAFMYKRLLNLNQRKRCWRTLHSFVLWWIRFTFTLGANNTKLGNLIQGNLKQSYELINETKCRLAITIVLHIHLRQLWLYYFL